jgi:ketosteroid isomerase-like protein
MEFSEFDQDLSESERGNVSSAYAVIDAIRSSGDASEGRKRLERLLADDFVSFTPTSDAARQQLLDKQAFIDQLQTQWQNLKSGSSLEITAHTAHGNRVATEMSAEILHEDGSSVCNRYHQLFLFDASGKISQYRTYMDSAAIVDSAIARGEALIRDFITALGYASPALQKFTSAEFEFHAADGAALIGVRPLLEKLTAIRGKSGNSSLQPIEGGLVVAEGVASEETRTPGGAVHSFVVSFDAGRVTRVTEFSSGLFETQS